MLPGPNSFEWVDSPDKVTHPEPSKQAAEVTLKRLKGAKLEQAPRKSQQSDPGWIISVDEVVEALLGEPGSGGIKRA
jgi:hypothetical protein